jgi:dTDP-4-amino-4,6-dideoxygalactose transaminase
MPAWTKWRRELATRYRKALEHTSIIVPREFDPGHVYHLFPIRSTHRARLQGYLAGHGIDTLVHYPVPIPRQQAMQSLNPRQCPITDQVCEEVCSLPLHPMLHDEDVDRVAMAIREF